MPTPANRSTASRPGIPVVLARVWGLLLLCAGGSGVQAQAPVGPQVWASQALVDAPRLDSLDQRLALAEGIRYAGVPPFIDTARNHWQWRDPAVLQPLVQALTQTRTRKLRVLHLGDSHVQADVYPGAIRSVLEPLLGRGGRGSVFPYAVARTHSAYDYLTYASGAWAGARNVETNPELPLGFHGASGYTTQAGASVRLRFLDSSVVADNTVLRIWHRGDPRSYDVLVQVDDHPSVLAVCTDASQPVVEVELPAAPRNLLLTTTATGDDARGFLELHGLSLETPGDSGIAWYSAGINGANFASILRQSEMPRQLEALAPDLIVLDISGNEYYVGGLDDIDFELKLRSVIAVLKRHAPAATVLLTCSQDIWKGNTPIAATRPAAAIARRVAFSTGCAFYDWYTVAGGSRSMLAWREAELAKRDRVHLTNDGYRLKGQLFANALLTSAVQYLAGQTTWQAPAVAPASEADAEPTLASTRPLLQLQAAPQQRPTPSSVTSRRVHVVRRGETLGHIARRYRVTTTQLRTWNRLRSTNIRAGQKLVVGQAARAAAASKPTLAQPKANPGTRYHTVRSGDTLWTIARQHGLTPDQLKRLNGLASSNIRPGQRLRLR